MNKKLLYSIGTGVFFGMQTVVGMYQPVVTAARLIAGGALIGHGIRTSYEERVLAKRSAEQAPNIEHFAQVSQDSRSFITAIMEQCGISRESFKILTNTRAGATWSIIDDSILLVPSRDVNALEKALAEKTQPVIDQKSMIIKHMAAHMVRSDNAREMLANVMIPGCVLLGSEVVRRGFNALFGIKPSSGFFSAAGRSLLSVSMLVPKGILSFFGMVTYYRYTQLMADDFACKNASSMGELVSYSNLFDGDTTHVGCFEGIKDHFFGFYMGREHEVKRADRLALVQGHIHRMNKTLQSE